MTIDSMRAFPPSRFDSLRAEALLAANKTATWGCYLAISLLLPGTGPTPADGRFFRSLLVPAVSLCGAVAGAPGALNFGAPMRCWTSTPSSKRDTKENPCPSQARLFHLYHRHDLSLDRAGLGVVLLVRRAALACNARHRRRPLSKGRPRRCGPSGSWPVSLDFSEFETKPCVCGRQTVVLRYSRKTGTLPVILKRRQQLKNPKTPTFYEAQNAPCGDGCFQIASRAQDDKWEMLWMTNRTLSASLM